MIQECGFVDFERSDTTLRNSGLLFVMLSGTTLVVALHEDKFLLKEMVLGVVYLLMCCGLQHYVHAN